MTGVQTCSSDLVDGVHGVLLSWWVGGKKQKGRRDLIPTALVAVPTCYVVSVPRCRAVRFVVRLAVVAANAADQLLDAAKPAAARAAMACECTWAGYEEAVVCCMAEVLTGEVGGKAITFPGAGQPNSRISRPAPAQGVCGVASLRKTCSR